MKKLLVISDSHHELNELIELCEKYKDYMIIHCGDYCIDEDILDKYGVIYVRGNCDALSKAPSERLIDVDGEKIFITHGHKYGVKEDLLRLKYKALEQGISYVFFGHTHVETYFKEDGVVFINPGSLRYTRSYALIEDGKVLLKRM